MKAFSAACIRLSAWYVLIIMAISLSFSAWVYSQARSELRFGLDRAAQTQTGPYFDLDGVWDDVIDDRLADSRNRLLVRLAVFNVGVLVAGAAGSYLLARRTLKPIEDSIEAQRRFTADASHELRTPLTAMKTEIEVSLRDHALSKKEAVQLLQSNLEEIDRLSGLAEGLLTLSLTDVTAAAVPIRLDKIAGKTAERLRPLADAKHITISQDLQPVTAKADAFALDKIVGILLDNAIKYSPADTAITLRTYKQEGYGCVEVRDQGVGIEESELPHIFDRFYRADASRSKTRVAGHGLGLSIAQKLATGLGGHVIVASAPGEGSVFGVIFPLV